MPRCVIIQHLEPEAPYAIGEALEARGVVIDLRRVYAGDPVPGDAAGLAGLVVMGGPMSARSDLGFPTRQSEIRLLGDAVARGVPTLGVCLGAQLLAAATGGTVRVGDTGPEIGWGPVELADRASRDPLLSGIPDRLTVLHWHGDTFDLPPGADLLASNGRYENQAFRVGPNAWGLQFHLEVTVQAVAAFIAQFGDEARDWGSDPAAMASESAPSLRRLAEYRDRVCARFADRVLAAEPAQALLDPP